VEISESEFDRNEAHLGGAVNSLGNTQVVRSTFSRNSAREGGGIRLGSQSPGVVNVSNSSFSENSAETTGGAIEYGGTAILTVSNSTFAGNSAATGGSIRAYTGAPVTLSNTIFADNTGGGECAMGYPAVVNGGGNYVEDGSCAFPPRPDPQLGTLKDNGGPTPTMTLPMSSPAFNTGSKATCAAPEPLGAGGLDQRGKSRPFCSPGAYEPQLSEAPAPTLTLREPVVIGLRTTWLGTASPGAPIRHLDSIHWAWGDGTEGDSPFPVIHKYAEPGTYTVQATAIWSDGSTAAAERRVKVVELAFKAVVLGISRDRPR
jgi:predicted outer membrane repeat protein